MDFKENAQWERINMRISNISEEEMKTFKRNEGLFIFATWSPVRFGVFYLKNILALMARNLSDDDLLLLDRITNRSYGNPITVRIKGRDICQDYMQALDEAKFMLETSQSVERIIEIGAGYGRTSHTLLSLNPNIEEYVIIDLAECMSLSRHYLERVLPAETFAKIRFVLNTDCKQYLEEADKKMTLAVNCDSLGEMEREVSASYLTLIEKHAGYFYSCNPVAKYDPACFEEGDFDASLAKDALEAGLLTAKINVFDDVAVEENIQPYLKAMKPDENWTIHNFSIAKMYTYYVHVLYGRDN